MPLDIVFFRKSAGYDPEIIRASQRKRFQDPAVVDRVIELDEAWRQAIFRGDGMRRVKNVISKAYGKLKKDKAPESGTGDLPDDLVARVHTLGDTDVAGLTIPQLAALGKVVDAGIASAEKETAELEGQRDKLVDSIGNIVHDAITVSQDEEQNAIVRTHGTARQPAEGESLLIHVDIMQKLGCLDCGEKIARIAGSRAYYLKGDLVLLHLGLINYALRFLHERGYTPIEPPVMMNREYLAGVCQLSDFTETLYAVSDGETEKYLVATAEQPICAWHANKHFAVKDLPLRWAGFSACYRKEAGAHGRDTTGIFRVHQFDKVEQFVVTTKEDSWAQLETMITNSEDFCKSLGLTYRVVDIVTGALNNAAARKYDLEAWFPGSKAYRELVSCSNCTDYQSRAIGAKFGNPPAKAPGGKAGGSAGGAAGGPKEVQEYVHMLNGTLCALSRTLCCIVEQYQCAEGVRVPEVLRPYMPHGRDLIPYLAEEPAAPAPAAPAPKGKAK